MDDFANNLNLPDEQQTQHGLALLTGAIQAFTPSLLPGILAQIADKATQRSWSAVCGN
jgi:ABC-type thiamine transport system substrate-binding protein